MESIHGWETYFYKFTTEPEDFQYKSGEVNILRNEIKTLGPIRLMKGISLAEQRIFNLENGRLIGNENYVLQYQKGLDERRILVVLCNSKR